MMRLVTTLHATEKLPSDFYTSNPSLFIKNSNQNENLLKKIWNLRLCINSIGQSTDIIQRDQKMMQEIAEHIQNDQNEMAILGNITEQKQEDSAQNACNISEKLLQMRRFQRTLAHEYRKIDRQSTTIQGDQQMLDIKLYEAVQRKQTILRQAELIKENEALIGKELRAATERSKTIQQYAIPIQNNQESMRTTIVFNQQRANLCDQAHSMEIQKGKSLIYYQQFFKHKITWMVSRFWWVLKKMVEISIWMMKNILC